MWAESVALVAPILAEPQEREIPCKRRTGKDHRQGALSLKPRLEEEIPQLKAPGKFQVLPSSPEATQEVKKPGQSTIQEHGVEGSARRRERQLPAVPRPPRPTETAGFASGPIRVRDGCCLCASRRAGTKPTGD